MTEPLVSVVTPVYNGEDYLDECIASVVAQSYGNWRYTIVNNCSTDRSGQIAESWAERDPRVRVVHNEEFLGQVENLNRAMALTDPEARWTKMVLADDWIFPECLERMVAAGEAHPSIGLVSAYRLDDRHVNCDGIPWGTTFAPGAEIARLSLVEHLFVSGTPNTVLYRSDIVRAREAFFATGGWHEDTEVFFDILGEHDFGYVHAVLSFTRRENESLTTAIRQFDPKHRLDKLIVAMKYGPRFLDADEFEACRDRELDAYYDTLGRLCMYRTPPGFWDYQHAGLERAGLQLDRGRFARRWLVALFRQLSDPGHLIERLRDRVTDRTRVDD